MTADEMLEGAEQAKAQDEEWLRAISSIPSLRSSVMILMRWVKKDHVWAFQNFTRALEVYSKELSSWKSNPLAGLHVIMACQLFENENSDLSHVTAPMIRGRALELFNETRKLSSWPDNDKRDLFREVKWPRLFSDLGIELKFPPSLRFRKKVE